MNCYEFGYNYIIKLKSSEISRPLLFFIFSDNVLPWILETKELEKSLQTHHVYFTCIHTNYLPNWFQIPRDISVIPLCANPIKWLNALKQFVEFYRQIA